MEFFKNPQIISAIIAFSGVIVGAIATGIITLLSDIIKFKRDEKTYYKRKREETYIEIIKFIDFYEIYGKVFDEIDKNSMLNALAKVRLYNSKEVQACLSEIMNNDNYRKDKNLEVPKEKIKKMCEIMKKDLKIED